MHEIPDFIADLHTTTSFANACQEEHTSFIARRVKKSHSIKIATTICQVSVKNMRHKATVGNNLSGQQIEPTAQFPFICLHVRLVCFPLRRKAISSSSHSLCRKVKLTERYTSLSDSSCRKTGRVAVLSIESKKRLLICPSTSGKKLQN